MSLADDAAGSPSAAEDSTATAAQVEQGQDVKTDPADTSTAEGDKSESLVDAVSAALNKDKGTEAPPASDAKKDSTADATAKAEAEDEEPDDEPDEEEKFSEDEWKALSSKTRRSIDRFRKQVADLKEPADRFRRIESFRQQIGASSEEVVQALNTLALVKTDPSKALLELRELAYTLSQQIGETLPSDLQQKVQQGTIDEETARELAQKRVQASGFRQAAEQSQAETEEMRVQRVRGEITASVTTWEKRISERDPDFAAKQPLVSRAFKALVFEHGRPSSAEQALKLMKQAYKDVSEDFRKLRPQAREEIRPSPASSATSAAAVSTAKTMEDAIRGSLNAA